MFKPTNGSIAHLKKSLKFSMNLVQKDHDKMPVKSHVLQKVHRFLDVALQLQDCHSNFRKEKQLAEQDLQSHNTGVSSGT